MTERERTTDGEGPPGSYLTYAGYLKLEDLLSLQQPLSEGPEHDEMLFIIIHQVYELWFKEVLHEVDYVVRLLRADDLARAQHTMKRILTILKVLVAQLDILETMTPVEFLTFRERLEAASGFQSHQFRELEFALGQKSQWAISRYPQHEPALERLQQRYEEPTLWDALLAFLSREGYGVPAHLLERDVTGSIEPDPKLQEVLVDVYRSNPAISELCERFVDLDEGLQEWRYRHVKMVERTIGAKPGTGGSAGVEYLRRTLFKPAFPDLWGIRTRL
ncbi:MAG: tryptophan 2,3-dioxygenase family protein [Gemmatimonadota bacterium]